MKWQARYRARLRQKFHELGVRSRGALAGWKDPQPLLRPYWPLRATEGAYWNHDLLFTHNRSILALFIPIDRERLRPDDRWVGAAQVTNIAANMARDAVTEEALRGTR